MALKPFDAYYAYVVMRLHFSNKDYDASKYNQKIRLTPKSFENRKDKWLFVKLSKRFSNVVEYNDFLLCNFVYGSKTYVSDLLDDNAARLWIRYMRLKEGFTNIFKDDIVVLRDEMIKSGLSLPTELFWNVEPGSDFPYIINMMLQKSIHIETVIALDSVSPFLFKLNQKIGDHANFIWPSTYLKLTKYKQLIALPISHEQIGNILKDVFQRELKRYVPMKPSNKNGNEPEETTYELSRTLNQTEECIRQPSKDCICSTD